MALLLVVAAGVSAFLHEFTDAVVILAIILLNAALGFVQDYRAEKALAALRKLAVPIVRVRREGVVREISACELVPGDIVLMEVGNYVPADFRLVESINLKIQEAALTGESEVVEKQVEPLEGGDDLPLGDRTNMAYMGTVLTYGPAVETLGSVTVICSADDRFHSAHAYSDGQRFGDSLVPRFVVSDRRPFKYGAHRLGRVDVWTANGSGLLAPPAKHFQDDGTRLGISPIA